MTSAGTPDTLWRPPGVSWMNDEPVRGRGPDPRLLALSGLEGCAPNEAGACPPQPIHHLVGLRPVTIGLAAVSTMPTSPRLCSHAEIFHAGRAACPGRRSTGDHGPALAGPFGPTRLCHGRVILAAGS